MVRLAETPTPGESSCSRSSFFHVLCGRRSPSRSAFAVRCAGGRERDRGGLFHRVFVDEIHRCSTPASTSRWSTASALLVTIFLGGWSTMPFLAPRRHRGDAIGGAVFWKVGACRHLCRHTILQVFIFFGKVTMHPELRPDLHPLDAAAFSLRPDHGVRLEVLLLPVVARQPGGDRASASWCSTGPGRRRACRPRLRLVADASAMPWSSASRSFCGHLVCSCDSMLAPVDREASSLIASTSATAAAQLGRRQRPSPMQA